MPNYIRRHTVSFINAKNGIKWAMRTQPNFLIHLLAFTAAILLALHFQIDHLEFLAVWIVSFMVLATEALNTAIEAATDITKFIRNKEQAEYLDYLIGVSKDVSAGAVLLSAICAVGVGIVVFGPYLLKTLPLNLSF